MNDAGHCFQTYSRIADLPPAMRSSVEVLVDESQSPASLGWIEIVERCCAAQGYETTYYLLRKGDRALGFSFNVTLPGISASNGQARRGPIRVFSSMLPLSNSTNIFARENEREELIAAILRNLPRRRWPCLHILVPHPDLEPTVERLAGDRLFKIPYYPGASLALPYASFAEYLRSLKSQRRKDVRRKMTRFAGNGCRFETCVEPGKHAERIYELYRNVVLRNEQHSSPYSLRPEFVADLAELMPGRYEIRLAKRYSEVIGFCLLLRKRDELEARFMGQDYACARETGLYFNIYYDAINTAIRRGASRIHLGITAADTKRRLGAELTHPSIYIGTSSRWLTRAIRWTGAIPEDKFSRHA